ncbi:VOC family protein [Chloroflexota bacterium]
MPEYWFDHVHLRSEDAAKTAEFYEQMFGAKRIRLPNTGGKISSTIKLDLNGITILIGQAKEGAQTGLVHFGIRTDKLDEAVKTIKDKGVEFTQDIKEVRPDFKISYLKAPDDVPVELQEGSF